MMQTTSTGFKVSFNPVEKVSGSMDFLSDMRNEGLWYAVTGKHFVDWLNETAHNLLDFIIDSSDLLIIPGMGLVILAMCGSKRSGKWLYWTVIAYLLLKMLGVML